MRMKRYHILFRGFALFATLLVMTGCYNEFDNPAPQQIYDDAYFTDLGMEIVPINQVKQLYYAEWGTSTIGKNVEIVNDWVIKGKVISNDAYGNIYRSLYIQDESGAIEIKVGLTNLFNYYKPGQWVYVRVNGLCLGNYRYMLSLGVTPTEEEVANGYSNSNISAMPLIDQHIFAGEQVGLTAADTTVITAASQLNDNLLGRLVRIEGLVSTYGSNNGNDYPSFLASVQNESGTSTYTDYLFEEVIAAWKAYGEGTGPKPSSPEPGTLEGPTYGFNNGTDRYYGSALFMLDGSPYIIRSSGYARFALQLIPADGAQVDVTCIYTKYSAKSGSYIAYQLLLNNYTDVVAAD